MALLTDNYIAVHQVLNMSASGTEASWPTYAIHRVSLLLQRLSHLHQPLIPCAYITDLPTIRSSSQPDSDLGL